MRTMEHARAKARELREEIGGHSASSAELLEKLTAHLKGAWKLDLVPMRTEALNGSRAQIDAEAGIVKYDGSILGVELLLLLAHELGHLVLHTRLGDPNAGSDPLMASAYGDAGPTAVARYSPRTYEEAQATAFALEFVCPSQAAWDVWLRMAGLKFEALAHRLGCTVDVLRVQLAHALHVVALGGPKEPAAPRDLPFTEAQLDAARFTGKAAIVDAGPGTGKTATVILRLQYLLKQQGANPSHVLGLTFSNEAAQELTERVERAFGPEAADAMTIRTFHGFGMEFLHFHGHLAGYTEEFRLLDEDAQAELVSAMLGRVPCDRIITLRDPLETAERVVEHINYCKHRLIVADDLERELAPWLREIEQRASAESSVEAFSASGKAKTPKQLEKAREKAREDRDERARKERLDVEAARQFIGVFRAYESAKREAQRMDFADLIATPMQLLESHPKIRSAYVEKFPWVIVDEFQDVTRATSRLLRALCGQANPPWVVGDARQAIYQFLGAAPENVARFAEEFPEATIFQLDVNFRSSPPVVTAANQLATLLERPEAQADELKERWKPNLKIDPLSEHPVSVAVAMSDAAEVEGVGATVRGWIDSGIAAGDIAVLARRHVDVRNVILALKHRGIVAQASGLLTSEGAAGDLAAVLTLADAPGISIMRLAFALGGGRLDVNAINATIAGLLADMRGDREYDRRAEFDGELAAEIMGLYQVAVANRYSRDGFATLAHYLFEDSEYLRRILSAQDSAERAMTLVEIVSSLSVATSYRSTHLSLKPAEARVGFAERFRVRLLRTLPIPLAPRPRRDAVHVMTCHASKGLEFPCVVVVGQTTPPMQEEYDWLAPVRRPSVSREEQQANSLLFVAVTRAQRAVVVTRPERATAGTGGKGKTPVPLLSRWQRAFGIHEHRWAAEAPPPERVEAGNIWDAPIPAELKASALDDSVCPLLTYLEKYHGARFPELAREMYPFFFSVVRSSLRKVAARANATGRQVAAAEAREVIEAEWPASRHADHAHAEMYRATAIGMVAAFARAFVPSPGVSADLDPEISLSSEGSPDVRLDLIAHFKQPDGTVVAVAFRPESLATEPGPLNWSDLNNNKRISLVLLENARPGIAAQVYSGADGRIYDYLWSERSPEALPKQAAALKAKRDAFARRDFGAEPTKFGCDRCRVRATCPHWIGALENE